MRGMRRKAVVTTAVIMTAGLGLTTMGAAPAGAGSKPSAEVSTYCAQLQRIGNQFGDPGIDAIFEGNPNPTLADWAAFLPGPIARLHTFVSDVEALDAPASVAPTVKTALRRLQAMTDYFERERQAAAAGDQKAFDAVGKQRVPLTKKMGKAFAKVGKVCGFDDNGNQ